MTTFGVFAAEFLMTSLGAVAFGHLGDRLGRKKAVIISVALMAVPRDQLPHLLQKATEFYSCADNLKRFYPCPIFWPVSFSINGGSP
jgi:MFS family permease